LGPYILDYYCQKARLAVELDGLHHIHHEISAEDEARTDWLEQAGVSVMRFYNVDVEKDPYAVYLAIKSKLYELGFEIEV